MFFKPTSLHLLIDQHYSRMHWGRYPSLQTSGQTNLVIRTWPSRLIGLEETRLLDPSGCILHFLHFTVCVEVIMVNASQELFYLFWTELISQ
jgi:hypothetical protein